jgi:hypothetical protein
MPRYRSVVASALSIGNHEIVSDASGIDRVRAAAMRAMQDHAGQASVEMLTSQRGGYPSRRASGPVPSTAKALLGP